MNLLSSLSTLRSAVGLVSLGLMLSSCGGAPPAPAPVPPQPQEQASGASQASGLLTLSPGEAADSAIIERIRTATLAADSAVRNNRPLLALVELEKLEQSGLPDTHRAMVWVNIGLVRGKVGALAAAKAAYDRAIELEKPLGRHFAMTLKAIFLAERGFPDESILIFEELLTRSDLPAEERAAYEENIRKLRVAPQTVVIR